MGKDRNQNIFYYLCGTSRVCKNRKRNITTNINRNILLIEQMENNNIKVSVIIPVYNTEKYVREAVDSISKQTLKELEIILVNDGSTDHSLQIIKGLSNMDSRITVYSQLNQGLSMARNAGLAHSQGKYIYFMDSDDLLEKDAMELCYLKCEEKQLDFVFFDAQSFFEDNVKNAPSLNYLRTAKLEDKTYIGYEALKEQLQNKEYTPSACLNFIRRNFLEKHHLQFYPSIIHEDQLFTTLLYLQAERTSSINRAFFHRRMRENSIMTRKFSNRNMEGYLTVTNNILYFKEHTTNTELKAIIDLYLSQMLNAAVWQAHTLDLQMRLRIAMLCFSKYKKYVSLRNIGVLLFKSFIHKS